MKKIFSLLFICTVVVTMCAVIRVDAESPINPHIKAVYEYKQDGSGAGEDYTGCLGGSEAGCTDIISTKNGSSEYAVGTIIKYEVKDGEERYFNVIKDNGNTLTLQERSNTSIGYYGNPYANTNEPLVEANYALYELEQVSNDWTYVNNQTYSIGDNTSTLGYSGCSYYNDCSTVTYTLTRTAKARMITVQELAALNCTDANSSCLTFVNNYLRSSTTYGGTFATDSSEYYWSLSANSSIVGVAWYISFTGKFAHQNINNYGGVRAVVVIDKATPEVTPPTPSESDATPEEGEVVNAEDTLKMSYIGYIMGVIVIFAGSYVIYLAIEKKYEDIEE